MAWAVAEQRVIRRDYDFSYPKFDQVLQTLDGGLPANPADLAALTVDVLEGLAKEIRDGDTSDWRQYWRDDRPEVETECRNRLLSDLKPRLGPFEAFPEAQHSDDARSDIRVVHGNLHVPIEVKKSTSRDVWTAISDQLIPKYTRDPNAAGCGIFLVFWFGTDGAKRPPAGKAPQNAEELRQRLIESLTPEQARQISICVVDVSRLSGRA